MKFFSYCFILFLPFVIGCAERETDFVTDQPVDYPHVELKGNVSGRLAKSSLPYYVRDNITIAETDTLVIDAGVQLFFGEGKGLTVYGKLFVEGKKGSPVTFSAAGSNWGGIKFTGSDTSFIKFTYISKTSNQSDTSSFFSGISAINSNILIANTVFSNNAALNGGAVYADSCKLVITNCIFRENYAAYYGGAILVNASASLIINNTFYKNRTDNFGGSVVLFNAAQADIQNNIFYLNSSRTGNPSIASQEADKSFINAAYNFLPGSGNPFFTSENDLHLNENSPCVNAGNPEPEYNDNDGSRNDLGSFGGKLGNW